MSDVEILKPQILTVGLNAIVNNAGAAFEIAEVGISAQGFTPHAGLTALTGEVARVPISGGINNGSVVEVTAQFLGTLQTWVRSVAFYNEDGIPIAIYSKPTGALSYKANGEHLVLTYAIDFRVLPDDSVTIVAGAPDLSLIYDEQFIQLAIAQVHSMTRDAKLQIQLYENDTINSGFAA